MHPSGRIDTQRAGMTLLELLVMITVMSVFIAVTAARMSSSTGSNMGAQADARHLAVDLRQMQRAAISTGNNHYLQFNSDGSGITGYTLYQRVSGVSQAMNSRPFSKGVTVTTTHTDLEYTFEGTALAAYQVNLSGPNHNWQVSVVPVTGTVRAIRL